MCGRNEIVFVAFLYRVLSITDLYVVTCMLHYHSRNLEFPSSLAICIISIMPKFGGGGGGQSVVVGVTHFGCIWACCKQAYVEL